MRKKTPKPCENAADYSFWNFEAGTKSVLLGLSLNSLPKRQHTSDESLMNHCPRFFRYDFYLRYNQLEPFAVDIQNQNVRIVFQTLAET